MAKGKPIGDLWPASARVNMSKEQPGIKVPDLLGNTHNYLITSEPLKEEIATLCRDVEVEYLRFTLFDHQKRPSPLPHFIINPIGVRDCLDLAASQIEYLDEPGDADHGAVVGVDRFVLDPRKLSRAPVLFRVRGDPNKYVADERLTDVLRAKRFTNLTFTEIELGR